MEISSASRALGCNFGYCSTNLFVVPYFWITAQDNKSIIFHTFDEETASLKRQLIAEERGEPQ